MFSILSYFIFNFYPLITAPLVINSIYLTGGFICYEIMVRNSASVVFSFSVIIFFLGGNISAVQLSIYTTILFYSLLVVFSSFFSCSNLSMISNPLRMTDFFFCSCYSGSSRQWDRYLTIVTELFLMVYYLTSELNKDNRHRKSLDFLTTLASWVLK